MRAVLGKLSGILPHCLPSLQALPYVCLLIAMLFFIYAIIGMQVILHPWGTRAAGGEPASEGARAHVAAPVVTLQLSRCLATSVLMEKMRTATRTSSKSLSTITSGPSSRRSCFSSGEGAWPCLFGLGLNLPLSCVLFITLLAEATVSLTLKSARLSSSSY